MDSIRDLAGALAAWTGQLLHAGWIHSHPAGHCDRGVILIVIGIIGFAWGGLGWTTEKKDAQLGPLEITHKESHGIAFPPIASGICLIGGIALVVIGSRKS